MCISQISIPVSAIQVEIAFCLPDTVILPCFHFPLWHLFTVLSSFCASLALAGYESAAGDGMERASACCQWFSTSPSPTGD